MIMINEFIAYLLDGGFVNIALFSLFLIITYGIGFRFSILYPGKNIDPKTLVKERSIYPSIQNKMLHDLLSIPMTAKNWENWSDELLLKYKQELGKFSVMVSTGVVLAPLLGLLGTVIGMIETFKSLAMAELFTNGGGIAGGISQALLTTQFGLIVAIPGVFLSKYLKRMENKTYLDLLQIIDILRPDPIKLTKEGNFNEE